MSRILTGRRYHEMACATLERCGLVLGDEKVDTNEMCVD